MSFGNNLVAARKRAGLTQAEVGESVGVSGQAVSQWERGETAPELNKIPILARRLQVPEGWLLSEDSRLEQLDLTDESPSPPVVKVVGYVGAGAEAHYYAVAQGDLDEVPAPPESTGNTVAVEIRGDSLGAALDRALAFYDDVRRPVTADLVGRLCVVGLADGRVLVKKVRIGSRKGHFTLISERGDPIKDALIDWAAKVTHIVPR